ncbi:sirohydrochlorin cobaltochelatase [Desulfovibrio sp. OttesenSCG-928-F20]|nr:sirohydrochlorin cobaltochelatase [Desulfovibrio sp. OttesenSCG-928-M16]MDL2290762.1 sirohydrochlorin cobaltochelatase [Desulfovibrio sp. OttesenSCG-928-F20]
MSATRIKTGILLAAFGSSSLLGEKALARFAERTRLAFPGIPVRWAYTSDRMRSRLAAAGKKTDSVKKALCRMGFERYNQVAVQSLHLIPGVEYEALLEETNAAKAEGGPRRISVGNPLLHDKEDVRLAAEALLAHLPEERQPGEAVVCMGHGTWHTGAASYAALSQRLAAVDPRIFIGTLSGEHSIDYILPVVTKSLHEEMEKGPGRPRVWLLPLLSIIGKHAEQDMAGKRADSWRNRFEAAGFDCKPVLTATVEYEGFAEIWLAHLAQALNELAKR